MKENYETNTTCALSSYPEGIRKESLYFIEIGRVDSVLGFGNSGLVLAIFDFL